MGSNTRFSMASIHRMEFLRSTAAKSARTLSVTLITFFGPGAGSTRDRRAIAGMSDTGRKMLPAGEPAGRRLALECRYLVVVNPAVTLWVRVKPVWVSTPVMVTV